MEEKLDRIGGMIFDAESFKKLVASEILSMIEQICFSDEYREYRVNYGSKGERDLIISSIKERYGV